MEYTKALSDVIDDLLNRGYTLGFQELEQARFDLGEENFNILPAGEFVIDEVYCCSDGSPDIIYVFAVSSIRYRMRGIVINAIASETTITASKLFQKIKTGFQQLFKR